MFKKVSLTLSAAALSFSVFASEATPDAKLSSCINRVVSNCTGFNERLRLEQMDECKIVQDSPTRVVFFDSNYITSVNVEQRNIWGTCDIAQVPLAGRLTDSVVFDGRLFFSHTSDRVVFVGRNNDIYEFLNAEGNSYSSVERLSVRGGKLILERKGRDVPLSEEQVNQRIAQGKIRTLAR